MCYNTKHILNNSNHFSLTNPFGFDVPCGHCAECNSFKESEWFVRSWFEFQKVRNNGGVGYFYTLTFNDDNIPRLLDTDVMCFDKRLVQKFIKRLKMQLWRKYKVKMSYLLTSEYGPLHQRPHHHANFYLSRNVLPFTFLSLVESCWQYGFVQPGNDMGVINGSSGILYTTKYITKDMSFNQSDQLIYDTLYDYYGTLYNNAFLDSSLIDAPDWDYLVSHYDIYTNNVDIIKWYNMFKREYHSRSTFYLHSNYLGYDVLNHPELINLQNETILVREGREMKEKPIPRFIARALWYDRVPNEKDGKLTLFKLNENGIKHKVSQLDSKILKFENKLRSFFSTVRLTDYQFNLLKEKSPFVFQGNKDFRFWLDNQDIDFHKLAIYIIVYRNRIQVPYYVQNQRYSLDYFNDYAMYYEYCLRDISPYLPEQESLSVLDVSVLNDIYKRLFNFLPEFGLYESLSILYKCMNQIILRESYLLRFNQHMTERKTRDIIKKSPLKFNNFVV